MESRETSADGSRRTRKTRRWKQRALRLVVGQFMRPHGLGGHVAGWVMALRSSNRLRSQWVVSLLDVQATDRIVEIGFGPGIALHEVAALATSGAVFGVDHSSVMVRQARRRNAAAVRAGRVDLRVASVSDLPDFGAAVDKIFAINSMGFWQAPVSRLQELKSLLRPGGRIAVASQPRCPGATEATSVRAAREIEGALTSAGFRHPRVETLALDPPAVCVIAERP
jgi:SAM-dependent methyltransferase